MAHKTIEYAIMVPVLILQVIVFPVAINGIMNGWVDQRRTLSLQEAASHLGSTVQQVYFSLNHETISAGAVVQKTTVPPYIEDNSYTGTATLRSALDPALNSSKILDITLKLQNVGTMTNTSVILGQNVLWQSSTFFSNSTNAGIIAQKFSNGTICLSFGG
jgi:hypothetical protein